MNIKSTKIYPKRLLFCLAAACGVIGAAIPTSVSSQTTPRESPISFRVTAYQGTYLKKQRNWYRQSPEIYDSQRAKCHASYNERLVALSYREPDNLTPVQITNGNSPYLGNIERPEDYWEVTLQEPPVKCRNRQNEGRQETWYIYKQHVNLGLGTQFRQTSSFVMPRIPIRLRIRSRGR
ncbi:MULTISPECIES: hypothetical protein [Nostocales]|uniref:Lipoprotein n=3 Tax=Nostocales TaxID=1161 RepID=A0A8S9SWR0_9CYAN|nr:hypothetical protein [Tolypothrix bouteillei]KAF3884276.1 hypothetical protein DA73_0400001305 [Tolypothrix bouteillei VB521301]